MIILAIGHRSRQGKDELANFLVRHIRMNSRLNVIKVGWADILKEVCYRLYSWAGVKPGTYYEHNPEVRNTIIPALGINVVQLWINIGMHGRAYDENMWINAAIGSNNADVIIFKDTRFENECEAVKNRGGILIKIEKPGEFGLDSVADNALNYFDDWDEKIINSGTLADLNNIAIELGDKYVLRVR